MSRGRRSLILLLVPLVVGVGAAVWMGLPEREPPDWRPMIAKWQHPDALPNLPLVDQDGVAFGLGTLTDRWLLVGFVFTRCGNAKACPLTMQHLAAVQDAWTPDDPALQILTLTIDPEYDTPRRLAAYGDRFGRDPSNWTLATGDSALMREGLPALFNILVLPEGQTLEHTVKIALLAPGGRLAQEWKGEGFSVAALREAVGARP